MNIRPSRSDQPFAQTTGRKYLDKHTNIGRPTSFSSDPPEEIFERKAFKAKALKPSYSTILKYRHSSDELFLVMC